MIYKYTAQLVLVEFAQILCGVLMHKYGWNMQTGVASVQFDNCNFTLFVFKYLKSTPGDKAWSKSNMICFTM